MKVVIVGYGSMGREVERVLLSRGHQVAARIDPSDPGADAKTLSAETAKADAAIEFSTPDVVLSNAEVYTRYGLSAVVGTTGWFAKLKELETVLKGSSIGYIYGSNFSIGAHIYFALVAAAAELSSPSPEYDIVGYEVHHKRKKDSPSGTALSIAKIIMAKHARKKELVTDKLDRAVKENELHFASVRGGEFAGTHTVLVDSAFDTIELTHRARSRGGFALGAVRAAEWLAGKKGLFEVSDFISDMLGRRET